MTVTCRIPLQHPHLIPSSSRKPHFYLGPFAPRHANMSGNETDRPLVPYIYIYKELEDEGRYSSFRHLNQFSNNSTVASICCMTFFNKIAGLGLEPASRGQRTHFARTQISGNPIQGAFEMTGSRHVWSGRNKFLGNPQKWREESENPKGKMPWITFKKLNIYKVGPKSQF